MTSKEVGGIETRRRTFGFGSLMTITSLPHDQENQLTALATVVWALLDAESRDDRMGAATLVPVFASSYNVWNVPVRALYTAAPVSLGITGGWTTAHDNALVLTLAAVAWAQGQTDAQIHALLGSFPAGPVPNGYRGVWFQTQVAGTLHAHLLDDAVADFRRDGAAGVSEFSDAVSRGIDPTAMVPTVPAQTPAVPQQTAHPSSAQASAFVLPHSTVLPDMLITGTAPRATEEFPVGLVLGLGTVTVLGLGLAAAAVKNRWFK